MASAARQFFGNGFFLEGMLQMRQRISAHHRYARVLILVSAPLTLLATGCTSLPTHNIANKSIELPLVPGWFEGKRVWYVTTDMSDKTMASQGNANYVPRLANALPPDPPVAGKPSSIDRIYKFMNFEQGSVLPSAPQPLGGGNTNFAYSPLWQLYAVYWLPTKTPHELHSEQEVLDAQDQGLISIKPLRVIVNCPVVRIEDTLL
jgi:hypothetical protein